MAIMMLTILTGEKILFLVHFDHSNSCYAIPHDMLSAVVRMQYHTIAYKSTRFSMRTPLDIMLARGIHIYFY